MIFKKIIVFLLAAAFWLIAGPTAAQISSASFAIPAGSMVGGGDKSVSTNYGVTGSIPLQPAGLSASTNYSVIGGVIGGLAGVAFSASYGGSAVITVTAGADYPLQVTIGSGSGADTSGTFYYRLGGQNAFSNAAMTKGAGMVNYTVPGTLLGVRGLEYYFKVKVGSDSIFIGDDVNPYAFISNLSNDQAQRGTAMPEASYRIIGVPLGFATRQTVVNVFLDDLGTPDKKQWRLGSYTNGEITEYPSAAEVRPGRGYWLIARGGRKYGAAGFSMRPNASVGVNQYYRLSVDTGWIQIANPLPFNVDWTQVRFDTAGVMVAGHPAEVRNDLAYSYDGRTYNATTVIPAWDGVFIHINRPGVRIYFPYEEAGTTTKLVPASLAPVKESPQAWSVQLSVEVKGRADDGNFAGVGPRASSGLDDYDFYEPPQAPEAPYLAFRLPEGDNGLFRTDIRPISAEGDIWNISISPMTGRILKASGLKNIPSDMSALLELSDGSIVSLVDDKSIILPDGVISGRLLIGTDKFLSDQGRTAVPQNYVLYQNYPNPFNPVTTIKFALPQAEQVKLDVVNILGQSVRTLVQENLLAGYHTVTWDGTDAGGHEVATGIYFYRLTAGDFRDIRKMLMIK